MFAERCAYVTHPPKNLRADNFVGGDSGEINFHAGAAS
jgi:hypothetical protein